ncbi:hypothetical protein BDN72DRAFT_192531 [Pluteus cervinus]|uniref:Uncharacterized protein n=1 Tax=Pluteus cervinus TaxID=181527 RepID=A0ACD3AJE7_9AGAR|nr:hypothetical protein BDN72DRAFT_192531 [Pluteus cervinus]
MAFHSVFFFSMLNLSLTIISTGQCWADCCLTGRVSQRGRSTFPCPRLSRGYASLLVSSCENNYDKAPCFC